MRSTRYLTSCFLALWDHHRLPILPRDETTAWWTDFLNLDRQSPRRRPLLDRLRSTTRFNNMRAAMIQKASPSVRSLKIRDWLAALSSRNAEEPMERNGRRTKAIEIERSRFKSCQCARDQVAQRSAPPAWRACSRPPSPATQSIVCVLLGRLILQAGKVVAHSCLWRFMVAATRHLCSPKLSVLPGNWDLPWPWCSWRRGGGRAYRTRSSPLRSN